MQQPYSNLTPVAENHIDVLKQNQQHKKTTLISTRFYTICQSLLQEIMKCSGYAMTRISTETQIPLITL